MDKKQNKYVFPNEENVRYFIVNMHNATGVKSTSIRDTFDFSNSRLIVLSNKKISGKGSFWVKVNGRMIPFNPNETDENKFKLCYFQNSKNVGFSVSGNAKIYGVQPQKEYENLHLRYDFLYFKVGKTCKSDSTDYYDDLFRLLTDYFSEGQK